jgi:hypothetical protein
MVLCCIPYELFPAITVTTNPSCFVQAPFPLACKAAFRSNAVGKNNSSPTLLGNTEGWNTPLLQQLIIF